MACSLLNSSPTMWLVLYAVAVQGSQKGPDQLALWPCPFPGRMGSSISSWSPIWRGGAALGLALGVRDGGQA